MAVQGEARLTIDLDALAANYAAVQREAAGSQVAPVVKADAYGMGMAAAGRRLWAAGARRFFVARLSEGAALNQALGAGRPARIYVLDGCGPGQAADLLGYRLTPVLNSVADVREWTSYARRLGRTLDAVLHVDTGMNRLGLRPEEALALADASDALGKLDVELLMTHFACPDPKDRTLTAAQLARFAPVKARFAGVATSLGASAGAFLGPETRGEVVRPGVTLAGGGPFQRSDPRLLAVTTLDAPILQVRTVRPGETVGYGASFTAVEPMRVATLGLGYADGVLRTADRPRYAWFAGARRAFLGRISMDLSALDVTGCDASPGDRVELYGRNLPVDDAAADAGTIAFELLANIAPRVRRVYVGAEG